MPERKALSTIILHRNVDENDPKKHDRVEVKPGETFNFTKQEVEELGPLLSKDGDVDLSETDTSTEAVAKAAATKGGKAAAKTAGKTAADKDDL